MRKIIFDFTDVEQEEVSIQATDRGGTVQKDSKEEMFDYINSIMEDKSYGIGLHSTQGEDIDNVLNSIMKNGLDIEPRKKILSTVSSFGTCTKISKEYLKQQMMQYSYGKQEKIKQNVIILVPSIISNSKGKQIYLGFPPYDTECYGNDFRTSCVLDTICSGEVTKGKIPPEFILGYYTSSNERIIFEKNPNYFNLLSEEQRDKFFDDIEERLKGKYKEISDAVISRDMQTLEKMSQKEQAEIDNKIKEGIRSNILERGVNRQLAETLSRSSVQIKQDDSATQALVYIERKKAREMEGTQPEQQTKQIRRILLDLYRNVKISDLTNAKNTLREGIEEPEKRHEGREI